ncbi:MAG: hypothetical protein EP343_11755 [Deltaproteobacteria bacterium]|nr:MAG: hypothetical protein EP343_11755 [Deltaproteobacteria bacterium]
MNQQQGERLRRWINQAHDGTRRLLGIPKRLVDHPVLRPRVQRTLAALGDTVFPPGGAIPYSGTDVEIAQYVIDYLHKVPRQEGELFTLVILLYEYVLPKMMAKGWTFSSMPESKRIELLEALHETPIFPLRFLNISLRMFLSFAYLSDERVLDELGFFKRYAYEADKRNLNIRFWPLREEVVEAKDVETNTSTEVEEAVAEEPSTEKDIAAEPAAVDVDAPAPTELGAVAQES